jgi:hypothetical protein
MGTQPILWVKAGFARQDGYILLEVLHSFRLVQILLKGMDLRILLLQLDLQVFICQFELIEVRLDDLLLFF